MVMTDPIADFLTRIRNANLLNTKYLKYLHQTSKKGLLKSLNAKVL